MKLTNKERRCLKHLLNIRDKPKTTWSMLIAGLKQQLFPLVTAVAAAAFFFWGGWPLVAALFLGAAIENIISCIIAARAKANSWELNEAIINWDQVSKLLNNEKESST